MHAPLQEWLACEDCLPLVLSALDVQPAPLLAGHWQAQNQRVLSGILVLEERGTVPDSSADDAELQRVHQKLDLLLDLFGALLERSQLNTQEHTAECVSLSLSREGLVCPSGVCPFAVGQTVGIELRLHPGMPLPLRWFGEVIDVREGLTSVRFAPMSEGLVAALERLVFIRHRRSVANARLPG